MSAGHVAPLAASATVEAGGLLGQAFVDDPLMRYYFEGDQDRSVPVCKTMTLATGLTLAYGTAFRLNAAHGLQVLPCSCLPMFATFPCPLSLRQF